jgi:hypothetical protein
LISLANDYGCAIVAVINRLASFFIFGVPISFQLSFATEFIKDQRPSEGFFEFCFFFPHFTVDFWGISVEKRWRCGDKPPAQCASRSLHRGNRSTTSRRKHKMWTRHKALNPRKKNCAPKFKMAASDREKSIYSEMIRLENVLDRSIERLSDRNVVVGDTKVGCPTAVHFPFLPTGATVFNYKTGNLQMIQDGFRPQ